MADPRAIHSETLRFDFLTPARIVFGWGRRSEVGPLARSLGQRAFLVSGSKSLERSGVVAQIKSLLEQSGLTVCPLTTIGHEPLVADVDKAVQQILEFQPGPSDLVVAVGGGSGIDLAKAVAALATNRHGHGVADFLEGVGKGLKIEQPPLPVLAIPTTAGTGSEATKNSVISSNDPPFKKSLRSELMVPRIVILDPELTVSLPPAITAQTGMDAITQLIESYISRRAQPIPQALAETGLRFALRSIETAVKDGANRQAREGMAYAAFLSGVALANSGLGLAHGVAAALGIHCHVAHGLACAVMLPAALRVNREVRQSELARLWSLVDSQAAADEKEAADRFIAHIDELTRRIGIPSRVSEIGVNRDQIPALAKGSRGNSMDGNPRDVSDDELRDLLERLL
jgi:alcohol dehydrogenase class IV